MLSIQQCEQPKGAYAAFFLNQRGLFYALQYEMYRAEITGVPGANNL